MVTIDAPLIERYVAHRRERGIVNKKDERVKDVSVTDGPFVESVEQLGGFYLVSSNDLDDLVDVCGILADGDGYIEVRTCVPAPAEDA